MRITSLPTRLWLLVVRHLPRRFLGREEAAALRVTRLPGPKRAELARNLREMLEPKVA